MSRFIPYNPKEKNQMPKPSLAHLCSIRRAAKPSVQVQPATRNPLDFSHLRAAQLSVQPERVDKPATKEGTERTFLQEVAAASAKTGHSAFGEIIDDDAPIQRRQLATADEMLAAARKAGLLIGDAA